MITFEECKSPGYAKRTLENAKSDVTIAIAKTFDTGGERLTAKAVIDYGKLYIPITFNDVMAGNDLINTKFLIGRYLKKIDTHSYVLNIAGNGIYNLGGIPQSLVDMYIFLYLQPLFETIYKPTLIRSGGQTGIDEAGLKAAYRLGIPGLCLAPKEWIFRGANGIDIKDEKKFKERFPKYMWDNQLSI